MTNSEKLAVFQAQTKNVRKLESSFSSLNKSINAFLRKGDKESARSHTLLAALVFCALSEVKFSKLIHTPHAFDDSEIDQIKRQHNLSQMWTKAIHLGIGKIPTSPTSSYKQNLAQRISRLLKTHITAPSEIRNKIAHGQWVTALNSENTKINVALTDGIANISIVTILIWKKTYDFFYSIVNDIIQSPAKAHFRDYYVHIVGLENYILKTHGYTLEDKIAALRNKPTIRT